VATFFLPWLARRHCNRTYHALVTTRRQGYEGVRKRTFRILLHAGREQQAASSRWEKATLQGIVSREERGLEAGASPDVDL